MSLAHGPETLVALLETRRRDTPARLAFRFLGDGEGQVLSDEALFRRATAVAAVLLARHPAGTRALLLYPPGLDYVVALCGCLLAGVVAVPAYPPRPNNSLRRLEDLAQDAEAGVALTTSRVAGSVRRLVQGSPLLAGLEWLATDALPEAEPPAPRASVRPETVALLQYTSGSTGTAKGVMLTHASLVHNLEQIRRRFGQDETSRGVIWLPPYHDMGLIGGILQPLWAGFTCDLMAPAAFLARPLRWLEAIASCRATTSGGPNFAYELALKRSTPEQRAGLDLSSWSVAFVGAEPVRADTLERFAAAFACAGFRPEAFYPCYGLAEATLMATGGRKLDPPRVLNLDPRALEEHRAESLPDSAPGRQAVSCGTCLDGQRLAIVDPHTCAPCAPGRVGEIWISGPSVAAGYWRRPEETEAVFGARLEGHEGRFLRTGDLGFARDGHVFPTGRLKDLIILRGANHYPQDIEASVAESHASLRLGAGAAFSVEGEGEERLVVVQEVERGAHPDTAAVLRAVRRNVAWNHGLKPLAVLLLGPGAVPRTSSGKVRRGECRRLFLAGEFEPLAQWREIQGESAAALPEDVPRPPAAEIERFLVEHFAGLLGRAPHEIDRRQPFAYYGLESAQAVQLARDLEAWLGLELPSTLAWDHPTIEALARHLAAPAARASAASAARAPLEPIAIVGLACRLPGAKDQDALWELLRTGGDAVTEVPAERFDAGALYDPDPAAIGRLSTRWGAFLERTDRFDPYFFGIAPREAVHMDPQQRLLLESAWEALEDAGRAPETLAGSATGVFVGLSNVDYTTRQLRFRRHLHAIDAYTGTGSAHCIAANRLSYLLDLRGPSLAVDTACSSALVALHLAVRSLAAGECELALCAGVNLVLAAETTVAFSRARMMAADGRCKPFDARADGFVRGEGCVTLVLKRLKDAQRDGDRVLGLVRGSAVNQDGRTNGLTAPSGPAQEAVLRAALQDAGLEPADISYVEAHGTGTALGDPIEIQALANVLGDAPRAKPCRVASMKANIGHLEPAAGLAGVAKVLLCLRHEALPPQRNLEQLNPHLRLGTGLEIPRELCPWPKDGTPRRAGVSAFGFGGTNAHVLIEEPPDAPAAEAPTSGGSTARGAWILPFSAHASGALGLHAERFADWLEAHPQQDLDGLCATAAALRAGRPYRAAAVGDSREALVARLRALGSAPAEAPAGTAPRVAFLFTGQGSQYLGMARGLYASERVFREALERCAGLLDGRLDLPLLELLEGVHGEAALEATAHAQPALFAVEYALCELWLSWGVRPAALLGHSVGEYVAACVAGAVDLADALAVIAARGRLMQALPSGGGMLALQAAPETLASALAALDGRLALAALNAPGHVVVSGELLALGALRERLQVSGVDCRELHVSHAFHSPLLEPVLPEFEAEAARVAWRAPRVPVVSNVDGDYLRGAPDAAYWRLHARSGVRFADGLGRLLKDGFDTFVEIGPAPVLSSLGRRHPDAGGARFLPSLRRGQPDAVAALQTAAALFEAGVALDWGALLGPAGARRVALPELPWQREVYWSEEPPGAGDEDEPSAQATGRGLAARRLRTAAPTFETRLSSDDLAYLREHRLRDEPLLPAAAFVEAALEAADAGAPDAVLELHDAAFEQLLFLAEQGPARLLQTQLSLDADGFAFVLSSAEAGPEPSWTRHAAGRLRLPAAPASPPALDLDALREACPQARDVDAFYAALQARGLNYGPAFRGVVELRAGERQALGRVVLPAGLSARGARLHPALLDACFHVLAGALPEEALGQGAEPYLPAEIGRLTLHGPAPDAPLVVHARLEAGAEPRPASIAGELRAWSDDGRLLFEVRDFRLRRMGAQAARARAALADALYDLTWETEDLPPAAPPAEPGSFVVLGDDFDFGGEIATRLEALGQACVWAPWPAADDDAGRALQATLASAERAAPLVAVVGLGLAAAPDAAQAARAALNLVRSLAGRSAAKPPRLLLVTRGAHALGAEAAACEQAPLIGLARVAAVEHPELGCALVDLDPAGRAGVEELLSELFAERRAGESAWRGGQRLVPALVPRALASEETAGGEAARLTLPAAESWCLDSQAAGRLERLVLRPNRLPDEPPPGCVEIEIEATGLNFSDVLKAMGLYPGVGDGPLPLGAECAGRVRRLGPGVAGLAPGEAVFGVAPFCFGNRAVTDARLLAPLPLGLTCEQAAAVPIAFLTAHYALDRLARLGAGESVLIHAAAGGVGLAAVQLAQRVGARLFATAGSPEKRALLRGLGILHVFDSRGAWADELREATGGEGVDVVLNSLPGDAIPRSLGLLRPYGRFLEIGKIDIYQDRKLGLLPFSRSLSYFAIDLDRMLRDRADELRGLLLELGGLLARGELRPLPLTVFDLDDAVAAFRYMAQRKNVGKVVLRRPAASAPAARAPWRADGTYLVTGALGGIGLRLAEWLAAAGVRHLALLGRRPPTPEQSARLDALRAQGVDVRLALGDVGRADELRRALDELGHGAPPLRGVLHAAGRLDDGALLQFDGARLESVLAPKVQGTLNLHAATRDCPLDLFVLFASAATLLGSPGQAAYAAANAFLDAFASTRRAQGLPVTVVDWGPWAEVGMAARGDGPERLARQGLEPIAPDEAFALLERLLRAGETGPLAVLPARWSELLGRYPAQGVPAVLRKLAAEHRAPAARPGAAGLDRRRLLDAPAAERHALLERQLRAHLSRVAGIPDERIDTRQPLTALGVDSLTALELKNGLEASLEVSLPMARFMEGPSIERLAALVVAQLPATSEPEAAATSAPTRPGAALSPPLLRRAADGEAPLSAPQERLLRLHAAGRAAPLPLLLQVEGALDVSALERAWAALVRRHDLLRTRFDGGRQLVDAGAAATLATAAFDGVPADLRAAAFRRRLAEECARPFDPSRGPLLRATLLRAGQDQHALLVAAHPLVFDEPSRAILTSELARAYDAALAGAEADLAPLPLQFGDYAAWQRAWLGGGEPGVGDGAPAPAYEALSVPLGVDAAATLGALAQEHGLDERVPWLACLLAALPATREAPPVRLGLSSANRARVGTEELIGPLAGFVAVPADLGGGPTFLQMLERLREALAGALRDEDRPWELRAGRDDAFPGLDRLAASLAFERALTPRAGDVRWRPLACETRLEAGGGRPRAALELALRQDENGTQATLLFAPRRVDQEQAEALARGLARAVERATAEPGRRLAELTETPLSVEAGRA